MKKKAAHKGMKMPSAMKKHMKEEHEMMKHEMMKHKKAKKKAK
jgi:hypothetical protein